MKLTWFVRVIGSRRHLHIYRSRNPLDAILVEEKIVAAVRRLIDFPANGRVGRIAGTRELVMNGTPYVSAYAVTETAVLYLRVFQGTEEWPDTLPVSQASFSTLKTTRWAFELVKATDRRRQVRLVSAISSCTPIFAQFEASVGSGLGPVPAYKDTVRQTTQVAPSPAGLGAESILSERRVEVE